MCLRSRFWSWHLFLVLVYKVVVLVLVLICVVFIFALVLEFIWFWSCLALDIMVFTTLLVRCGRIGLTQSGEDTALEVLVRSALASTSLLWPSGQRQSLPFPLSVKWTSSSIQTWWCAPMCVRRCHAVSLHCVNYIRSIRHLVSATVFQSLIAALVLMQPAGLWQRNVGWSSSVSHPSTSVGSECSGTTHIPAPSFRPHQWRVCQSSLVTSAGRDRFQDYVTLCGFSFIPVG